MKLETIGNALSKLTGRTGLILKKNSPTILMVLGIGGVIGTVVIACKATLNLEDVLKKGSEKQAFIKEGWEKAQNGEAEYEDYTEQKHAMDVISTHVQTGADLLKLYGPALALGTISIGCLVGSHHILKGRNVALMAAYKAIDEGFQAYRKRVIEDKGEDADFAYRNNLKAEEVTATEVGDDGKNHKIKKTIFAGDPTEHSIYARFFDESCAEWSKSPEYNMAYLRSRQNYFNDMLRARGHVFLNEVYDALGIPRTDAGQVVGWVIGKDGDNYVDFGVFDRNNPGARAFVNGYERNILLDFNVQGVIYDLI